MRLDATRQAQFRDVVYDVFAGVGKALGHRRRLVIFEVLCHGERNVEEIARQTGMPFASASQHLQVLRSAGLVTSRRDGAHVHYSVSGPDAVAVWRAVREFAEAELPAVNHVVDTYLSDRRLLEAISSEELRRRLSDGSVILIDLRPSEEFEAGHIPGAVSIPLDELDDRVGELPDGVEVIAYCRGRYCIWADTAVRKLRERGIPARRCELAVYDWA